MDNTELNAIRGAISRLISSHEAIGLVVPQRLRDELGRLDRDLCVAVVGEYKVGKSSLINSVFLAQDILPRDLLECTAVPTLVRRGERPGLTIRRLAPDGVGVLTQAIESPTTADIQSAVTRDTPEGRADLARTTVGVELAWPAAALEGFCVYDTPGVDSGNEAVVTTTCRVVPESDCVIFLKTPKSLSQPEREFLRSRILEQGLDRVLVLVPFDGRGHAQDAAAIGAIVAEVLAALANMGRGSLPVEPITLNFAKPAPVALNSAEAIRRRITDFVLANAIPGRIARATHAVRQAARQAQVSVQAELAALSADENKRKELAQKLARDRARLQQENDLLVQRVEADLTSLRRRALAAIGRGLMKLGDAFVAGFTDQMSLDELQGRLRRAGAIMQPDIELLVEKELAGIRVEADRIVQEAARRSIQQASAWQVIATEDLKIDGGILDKVPNIVLVLADIVLTDFISPLPLIVDVVVRQVLIKIPGIRDLMPAQLARKFFLRTIRNEIPAAMDRLRADIAPKMEAAMEEGVHGLRQALTDSTEAEIAAASTGLERAAKPDPARRQQLDQQQSELKLLLNELQPIS